MKKIHLDPEALDVVSFTTGAELYVQGTVHGREVAGGGTEPYYFTGPSCDGLCETREYDTCREAVPTVGPSCDEMCGAWTVGCYPYTEPETCV